MLEGRRPRVQHTGVATGEIDPQRLRQRRPVKVEKG